MTAMPIFKASDVVSSSVTASRPPLSVAIYMHDLAGGGVERQSLGLAREFMNRGVGVTLVLHRSSGELSEIVPAGLPIVDLKSSRTIADVAPLARYLRAARPDVLLANVDHNNVAALMAKALAGGGTRVVICQHNPVAHDRISKENWTYRLVPYAYFLLSPFINSAVAVSGGVAAELMSIAGLPRAKVKTIHNPVISGDFAARCRRSAGHPWCADRNHRLFVTAGRLVPQKDHETLLRALALHRERMPSRLLVLGAGPMLERLQTLAGDIGVLDAVQFTGFQDNPLPLFRDADAFVLSSRTEGFGNVLVEAMGCGTPVIATDCPHGPAEILDDGRYGLLVPPGEPAALAAAMDRVTTLRDQFPEPVLKARAAEFSYAVCADRYLNLFRTLVPDVERG
jgi:glycosyltransferase involved in cell wall biosynthesis